MTNVFRSEEVVRPDLEPVTVVKVCDVVSELVKPSKRSDDKDDAEPLPHLTFEFCIMLSLFSKLPAINVLLYTISSAFALLVT